MMVVFLCGLVALILLRTLRNDFARYAKGDGDDAEIGGGLEGIGEDSGWKQVHGDVFRAPEHLVLFSALMGTGWQLIILILGVILYAMAGVYNCFHICLEFFLRQDIDRCCCRAHARVCV